MSNEEIVTRIQAGERELMGELWSAVENLVRWKARRVINSLHGAGGVEYEDLCNSGYLAMAAAVDTYTADSGTFANWLIFYLKTTFAEATGYRTEKGKKDPLRDAVSLSNPLGDATDGGCLADILPDPGGELAIKSIEEKVWQEQLRSALENALSQIPTEQSDILRHRYYKGQTLASTASELKTTAENVRKLEGKGLTALRHYKLARQLQPFYEFDYYCATGLGAFKSSGMSIQERYLIKQER